MQYKLLFIVAWLSGTATGCNYVSTGVDGRYTSAWCSGNCISLGTGEIHFACRPVGDPSGFGHGYCHCDSVSTTTTEAMETTQTPVEITTTPTSLGQETQCSGTKLSACCSGIFQDVDSSDWELEQFGGATWSVSASTVRFTIADSHNCADASATGSNERQYGSATLQYDLPQDTNIRISMNGRGESQYENLKVSVDGQLIVDFTASDSDVCQVNSCSMCEVDLPDELMMLEAGQHTILVEGDTKDAHYHQDSFFEVTLVFEGDASCSLCQCPDTATTTAEPTTTSEATTTSPANPCVCKPTWSDTSIGACGETQHGCTNCDDDFFGSWCHVTDNSCDTVHITGAHTVGWSYCDSQLRRNLKQSNQMSKNDIKPISRLLQ